MKKADGLEFPVIIIYFINFWLIDMDRNCRTVSFITYLKLCCVVAVILCLWFTQCFIKWDPLFFLS